MRVRRRKPLAHLFGGFLRKRKSQDRPRCHAVFQKVLDPVHQRSSLPRSRTRIHQERPFGPSRCHFLAFVQYDSRARIRPPGPGEAAGAAAHGSSGSSPDSPAAPTRLQSPPVAAPGPRTPAGANPRGTELAREDIRLDLLPLVGRVPFDLRGPAFDRVTAQEVRRNRHLVSRVVVQLEVPNLVGRHHGFVFRVQVLDDVDSLEARSKNPSTLVSTMLPGA